MDMDRQTGRAIDGAAAVRQSVADILTTPLGARVMLPEYGSRLPDMIDGIAAPGATVAMAAEAVGALARWEPRVEVAYAAARVAAPGQVVITLSGRLIETPAQEFAAEVEVRP